MTDWLTEDALTALVKAPARLTWVETATVLMRKSRRPDGTVDVRIHALFRDAPEDVQSSVLAWIRRPARCHSAAIRPFVDARRDRLSSARRPRPVQPVGATRDLRAIVHALNQRYFEGSLDCQVTFSRPVRRRRRQRSLQFGSYDPHRRTIRIHPVLDDPFVPDAFVEFVVFHEMLHATLGSPLGPDGRCRHHGAEFRARERTFERYAEALAWEERNLGRLLALAAKVRPAAPGAPRQRSFDFGALL